LAINGTKHALASDAKHSMTGMAAIVSVAVKKIMIGMAVYVSVAGKDETSSIFGTKMGAIVFDAKN
jgi:hypothetical protein